MAIGSGENVSSPPAADSGDRHPVEEAVLQREACIPDKIKVIYTPLHHLPMLCPELIWGCDIQISLAQVWMRIQDPDLSQFVLSLAEVDVI